MSLLPGQSGPASGGGRFDFDDGGTYCGGWEDGKAHGQGVCTGPKGQGEYSGSWHFGFEVSGVYTWPSGSTFEGQWQNGKRHGLGVETRGRWIYRGEWTQGFKGRYGVRQSISSGAKYEGTWANGLQDGYGSETYADGGTYQGQWLRGMRHGYGVRTSAPFGLASHYRPKNVRASLTSLRSEHADPASERDRKIDDCRGGFVLKAKSDEPPQRRRSLGEKSSNLKKSILQGLRIKKQRSTGDIDKRGVTGSVRSTGSTMSTASSESERSGVTHGSAHTDSNVSFVSQDDVTDANVLETYMGEWKNDKRSGFGIAERSDGLKYEGEWYNNKKYGYGVTTFKDGAKEEGKYKNNVLVTSGKKKHLFLLRSAKFRERIDAAVNAAVRASQIALQKADIAISRTATARGKAEQADVGAMHAREDSDVARLVAKQFAPDFHQPGTNLLKRKIADGRDSAELGKLRVPHPDSNHQQQQQRARSLYSSPSKTTTSSRESLNNPGDYRTEGDAVSRRESLTVGVDRYGSNNPDRRASQLPDAAVMRATKTNYLDPSNPGGGGGTGNSVRRPPRGGTREGYSLQQAMNDHFDQYRVEPPPRTRRSQTPLKANSVAPPIPPRQVPTPGYGPDCTPDSGVSESMDGDENSPTRPSRRSTLPNLYAENFLKTAVSDSDDSVAGAVTVVENSPESATPLPQRTASMYKGAGGRRQPPSQLQVYQTAPAKRKKSLPDITALTGTGKAKVMTREEVAALSSQRREEVRKQQELADRLRANPLLYLFNPDVKDWLSRQQLVMLVLFINISLAIMFFKLLT